MWPHSKLTGFSTRSISVYLCTLAQEKKKKNGWLSHVGVILIH